MVVVLATDEQNADEVDETADADADADANAVDEEDDDGFLHLNISGRPFDVPKFAARSKPHSLLACLLPLTDGQTSEERARRRRLMVIRSVVRVPDVMSPTGRGRWFAPRTPTMFELVLQYLYTNCAYCPPNVCLNAFNEELKFWRLTDSDNSNSDWDSLDGVHNTNHNNNYNNNNDIATPMLHRSALKARDANKDWATVCRCRNHRSVSMESPKDSGLGDELHLELPVLQREISHTVPCDSDTFQLPLFDQVDRPYPDMSCHDRYQTCMNFLWRLCHGTQETIPAKIFNTICLIFIVISIMVLIMASVPEIRQCTDDEELIGNMVLPAVNSTGDLNVTEDVSMARLVNQTSKCHCKKYSVTCVSNFVLDVLDAICVGWFTLELMLRFLTSNHKKLFLISPLNIIDFLGILPFYVELAIWLAGNNLLQTVSSLPSILTFLRILRVLRVFRVLRLARYFVSMKLFGEVLLASRVELGILILFLTISMIIFSSLLYYLEKDVEDATITSIPAAFYWSVVTLTTVGYGDITAKTPAGKFVASVACISGIIIVALPVTVFVERFNKAYKMQIQSRKKIRRGSVFQLVSRPFVGYNSADKSAA